MTKRLTPLERATPLSLPASLSVDTVRSEAHRAYIKVSGRMDRAGGELVGALLDVQLTHGRRFVRLDLSAVNEIDVDGVASLVSSHQRVLGVRGTLVLAEVGGPLRRTLGELAGDAGLLILDPTADRGIAVASFVDEV